MSSKEEVRNELTPKYRGDYDKAKTGRSPMAAIRTHCRRCMASKTKEIRDCTDEGCEFHQYRPYQENPYKFVRRSTKQNLNRTSTGQIVKTRSKRDQPVSKDVLIKNAPEGQLRLHIEIVPEK